MFRPAALPIVLAGALLPAIASSQVVVSLGVRISSPTGVPTVAWTPVKGGTRYSVERWKLDDLRCCRSGSKEVRGTSWTDAALPQPGTYVYRVTVYFADGQFGYNDQQFAIPRGAAGPAEALAAAGPVATAAGAKGVATGAAAGAAGDAATGAAAAGAEAKSLATGAAAGAAGGAVAGAAAASTEAKSPATGVAGAAAAAGGAAAGAAAAGGGAVNAAAGNAAAGAAAAGASKFTGGAANAQAGAAGAAAAAMPANPTGFVAVQTGENLVRLSWSPEPGVSTYLLIGPGLPMGGVSVSRTTYDVAKVAAGAKRWLVGSVSGAGLTTAREAFSVVDLVVRAP